MNFAIWNVKSLYRSAAIEEAMEELARYKINTCAVQKIRWPNNGILRRRNETLFYSGSTGKGNQFGTRIFVSKKRRVKVTIRLKLKPLNITIIATHNPTEEKKEK